MASMQPQPIVPMAVTSQTQNVRAGRHTTAPLSGGNLIGGVCSRLAYQLGHGPEAVIDRISNVLRSHEWSPTGQPYLPSGVGGKLEKDCLKLMKYALQTTAPAVQFKAFKSIVHLTTRSPGLRCIFLRCKRLQAAGATRLRVIRLWMGVGPVTNDAEWIFYLGFAASSICDEDELAGLLEDNKLGHPGYIPIDGGECSVIERLLVASESGDEFEPWIAIRYLGTILESSYFWVQDSHYNHQAVCQRLFQRARKLVEDLDVEHNVLTQGQFRGDVQGIDILTSALLKGARIWRCQEPIRIRPLGPLSSNYARLIALVQHPASQYLLPQSYGTVSSEYGTLVGMTYQCESVEVVVLGDRYISTSHLGVQDHADGYTPNMDTGPAVGSLPPADLSLASPTGIPERKSLLSEDIASVPPQSFHDSCPVSSPRKSFLLEVHNRPCSSLGQRSRIPRGPRPMTPNQQTPKSTCKNQGMLASPGDPDNQRDPEQPALSTLPLAALSSVVSLHAPSVVLDSVAAPSRIGHSTTTPEREPPVSIATARSGQTKRLSAPSVPFIYRSPMKSKRFSGSMYTSSFSTLSLDNSWSMQTPVTTVSSHRFSFSKPSAWGEGLLKGSICKKHWR